MNQEGYNNLRAVNHHSCERLAGSRYNHVKKTALVQKRSLLPPEETVICVRDWKNDLLNCGASFR